MAETTEESDAPKRKRRFSLRPRFSLRSIIVLTLLCAILFSYLGRPTLEYLHDKRVTDRIEDLGGTVTLAERPLGWPPTVAIYLEYLGAGKAMKRLSKRVVAIDLKGSKINLSDAQAIAKCQDLTTAILQNVGLTNEMLIAIAESSSLTQLQINKNPFVNDVGAKALSGHPTIALIGIVGTRISNRQYREILENPHGKGATAVELVLAPNLHLFASAASIEEILRNRSYQELDNAGVTTNRWGKLSLLECEREELDMLAEHVNCIWTGGPPVELTARQYCDYFAHNVGSPYSITLDCSGGFEPDVLQRMASTPIRSLELVGRDVPLNLEAINSSGLLELKLPTATRVTTSLLTRENFPNLSTLQMPNAQLSRADLRTMLQNDPLKLNSIELPEHLHSMRDEVANSGIALRVKFACDNTTLENWKSNFADLATAEIRHITASLSHEPWSPFVNLPRTYGMGIPVLKIAESPSKWQSRLGNKQPHPLARSLDLCIRAVEMHIEAGEIDNALDDAIRLLYLWPFTSDAIRKQIPDFVPLETAMEQGQNEIADLCQYASSKPDTMATKRLVFIVPDQEETTWQSADELIGPWNRVGIIAPTGFSLSEIRCEHERLNIKSLPAARGKQKAAFSKGAKRAFVTKESFPLTVNITPDEQ